MNIYSIYILLFALLSRLELADGFDGGHLQRSYDYWVSIVEEAIGGNQSEMQPFLSSVALPTFSFTMDGDNQTSSTNIFDNYGTNLRWLADLMKPSLSESCLADLSKAAAALSHLGGTTVQECQVNTDDSETSVKECTKNQHQSMQENMWILQILNSFGTPTPGLFLQGQYLWFGSYLQCRHTKVPDIVKGDVDKSARYCMVSLGASAQELTQPGENEARLRVKWGTCMPDGCVTDGHCQLLDSFIWFILNKTQKVSSSLLIRALSRYEIFCEAEQSQAMSNGQVIFLVVFSTLLVLIIAGTIVDYKVIERLKARKIKKNLEKKERKTNKLNRDVDNTDAVSVDTLSAFSAVNMPALDLESVVSYKSRQSLIRCMRKRSWWMKILMSFSVRLSVHWLFQTKERNGRPTNEDSSNRITCLYGIKALTMLWVILGHSCIFALPHVSNLLYVSKAIPPNIAFQFVLNASLAVDTFLLISGLLTSYMWCLRMLTLSAEKQRLFNVGKWLIFYAHRLVRLIPPYALVLAFVTTWFVRMGDGPQWDPKHIYGIQCDNGDVWWRHLLLISNLVKSSEIALCLPWMWHLAVDVQLYMSLPLFLILLWKWPKVGIVACGVVIVSSAITRGLVISTLKLPTNLMLFLPDENFNNDFRYYFEYIYEKPYFRCGPYFIGVIVGWALAIHGTSLRFASFGVWKKIVAWIIVAVSCLWPLLGAFPLLQMFYNPVYNALYAAINRTLWSVGVAMLICMCHLEKGGRHVNAFLSWTKFWPASRLTYSVYLTHELFILFVLYSMWTPIDFNGHFLILSMFFLIAAFSYPLAFLVFALIEAPALAAERLLFRRKKKRTSRRVVQKFDDVVDRKVFAKRWAEVSSSKEELPKRGMGLIIYDDVRLTPAHSISSSFDQRSCPTIQSSSTSGESDSEELFIELPNQCEISEQHGNDKELLIDNTSLYSTQSTNDESDTFTGSSTTNNSLDLEGCKQDENDCRSVGVSLQSINLEMEHKFRF